MLALNFIHKLTKTPIMKGLKISQVYNRYYPGGHGKDLVRKAGNAIPPANLPKPPSMPPQQPKKVPPETNHEPKSDMTPPLSLIEAKRQERALAAPGPKTAIQNQRTEFVNQKNSTEQTVTKQGETQKRAGEYVANNLSNMNNESHGLISKVISWHKSILSSSLHNQEDQGGLVVSPFANTESDDTKKMISSLFTRQKEFYEKNKKIRGEEIEVEAKKNAPLFFKMLKEFEEKTQFIDNYNDYEKHFKIFIKQEIVEKMISLIASNRYNNSFTEEEIQVFDQLEQQNNKLALFFDMQKLPKTKENENFKDFPLDIQKYLSLPTIPLCITQEDIIHEINHYKEAISLLKRKDIWSNQSLFSMGEYLGISRFSPDGVQLTLEIYEFIQKNTEKYAIEQVAIKPSKEEIMSLLQQGSFFVIKRDRNPEGSILATSHTIHDNIVILYPTTELGPLYCAIGMFTSAKSSFSTVLSKTQEFNEDIQEGLEKEQAFCVFHKFEILSENDMKKSEKNEEATKFSLGFNKEGENVHEKIINCFKETQEIWSDNWMQKPLIMTQELFQQILIDSCQNKLETLEKEEYSERKILANLDINSRHKRHASQEAQKQEFIKEQKQSLYFQNQEILIQNLIKFLREHRRKIDQDEEEKKNQQQKAQMKHEMSLRKQKQLEDDEKRRAQGHLTATEKKQMYLNQKQANQEKKS